ncbi:MAG TPA: cation diffusion facilitator family transporter [Geobacteraceae bacterium]|nr:cation diffusion facilitator family transporter [Geobacteraceae bacterium]
MHQAIKNRAALLSIISNSVLIVFKLTVGIMMHSVSVVSEAVHSGIDLVASIIAWFSVKESGKPADDVHRFGHGKIENLAGSIEALLIFGAAIYIIVEAVKKLVSGTVQIEGLGIGAAVMTVSAIANYFVSRHLMSVARRTDSVALEADSMHLRTDVYTSIGVLAGLIAIKLTGAQLLDPIVAIGVALLIIKAAYGLAQNAFLPILDVRLPDAEEQIIIDVVKGHPEGVLEYHKLRTRKSGHIRHIDMHLLVPKGCTVVEAHRLSHEIARQIEQRLPESQILVHIEPCREECDDCPAECPEKNSQ